MSKFRFYIASMANGEVKGSDDPKVAEQMCGSEDDFVIDTQTGCWLGEDMTEIEIEEQELYKTDIGAEEQEEQVDDPDLPASEEGII